MVFVEISKLKFNLAEELSMQDVEFEHNEIGSRCNRILNGIFDGKTIGDEIPAIEIDGQFEVQDGYHRVACLLYANYKYPDEYHFTHVECKIV
jgi:limonene-1,2-epoxide hydrolase